MPKRRYLTLTEYEHAELLEARDHDPRPFVRERCAALLRIAAGESAHAVACAGIVKPRQPETLYAWMDYYAAAGLAGLQQHQQGGSPRGRLRPSRRGSGAGPGAPWPG